MNKTIFVTFEYKTRLLTARFWNEPFLYRRNRAHAHYDCGAKVSNYVYTKSKKVKKKRLVTFV